MKKVIALAVAAGLLAAGAAQAQDKIRIATEGAYPPFNYIDASGELKGFDVDIAKALCEQMDAECEIVAQDWDGIIPGLLAGKYDAIIASMSITPERKQAVDFTDKYYQTPARFVAEKGSDIEISEEGLEGKTIGAQRATTHANYLEDTYGDVADIKLYDSQENANLDLASGRLDAVLADSVVLAEWLKTPDGQDFEFVGEPIFDPEYFGEGIGIALRKGEDELREKFNQAIQAIREDGTYDEIRQQYFDFDIYGS